MEGFTQWQTRRQDSVPEGRPEGGSAAAPTPQDLSQHQPLCPEQSEGTQGWHDDQNAVYYGRADSQQEEEEAGAEDDEEESGDEEDGGGQQWASTVDFGLDREEVLGRIEQFCLWWAEELFSGSLPTVSVQSRRAGHAAVVEQEHPGAAHGSGTGSSQTSAATAGPEFGLRLLEVVQTRCLLDRRAEGAYTYVRMFQVMRVVHELLTTRTTATLREVYYRLLSPPIFCNTTDVNEAIQDVIALLRVPRSSLNLCAAAKGAFAGAVRMLDPASGHWQDCRHLGNNAGRPIPGDLSVIDGWRFDLSAARALLVVEKDAVFQRLSEDAVWRLLPVVLLTAKGMPDVATRALLRRLHDEAPHLPVAALVDWNPAGACIALTYKYGGYRMALEAPRFAVPTLAWLGLRSPHLAGVDPAALQPLTRRDASLLGTLRGRFGAALPEWVAELQEMEATGHKAEIEALYSITGLTDGTDGLAQWVAEALEEEDYLP